jgi:hypothetical protein
MITSMERRLKGLLIEHREGIRVDYNRQQFRVSKRPQ